MFVCSTFNFYPQCYICLEVLIDSKYSPFDYDRNTQLFCNRDHAMTSSSVCYQILQSLTKNDSVVS